MGKDKIENLESRLSNTKTKGDVEAVLMEIEKLLSKNNNIDIYANPNTNFDPWLD